MAVKDVTYRILSELIAVAKGYAKGYAKGLAED